MKLYDKKEFRIVPIGIDKWGIEALFEEKKTEVNYNSWGRPKEEEVVIQTWVKVYYYKHENRLSVEFSLPDWDHVPAYRSVFREDVRPKIFGKQSFDSEQRCEELIDAHIKVITDREILNNKIAHRLETVKPRRYP